MPKLTTETEPAVDLSPELHARLENALAIYDMAKAAMEHERATIEAILNEGGTRKVASQDGRPIYITVGGTTSRLDKKKLVALGVQQATIDAATTRSPKKPYLTIGKKPGEAQGGDDDD